VAGAGETVPLVRAEADTFMRLYPKARIDVIATGTVAALESLVNRQADVAALWRAPTQEELRIARSVGESLSVFPYAVDGLGVIVAAGNTVPSLSVDEVQGLLLGRIRSWSEVNGPNLPVTVYAPDQTSGVIELVVRDVLPEGQTPAWVAMPGDSSAPSGVINMDAGGMTFGGLRAAEGAYRAVPIRLDSGEEVLLHPADLIRKRYPWVTRHVFCVRGEARDLAGGFISYVTSAEGQRMVVARGYGPATMPSRLITLTGQSGG
jgi:phosphate transport system substrate-binding protein